MFDVKMDINIIVKAIGKTTDQNNKDLSCNCFFISTCAKAHIVSPPPYAAVSRTAVPVNVKKTSSKLGLSNDSRLGKIPTQCQRLNRSANVSAGWDVDKIH